MTMQKDLCEINKQEICRKIRLLCITCPRKDISYHKQVELACLGGADMIQLRDKSLDKKALIKLSRELQEIAKSFEIPFTLNDDPLTAHEAGCDGVHIGKEDMPYEEARKALPYALIGVSAQTAEEAYKIAKTDADYIGLGPIFDTPMKEGPKAVGLSGLKEICSKINTPVIAIGGIGLSNVEEVIKAGAQGIAVIRAVCGAQDIKSEAKKLKEAILKASN